MLSLVFLLVPAVDTAVAYSLIPIPERAWTCELVTADGARSRLEVRFDAIPASEQRPLNLNASTEVRALLTSDSGGAFKPGVYKAAYQRGEYSFYRSDRDPVDMDRTSSEDPLSQFIGRASSSSGAGASVGRLIFGGSAAYYDYERGGMCRNT